jgi:hypothetical protein
MPGNPNKRIYGSFGEYFFFLLCDLWLKETLQKLNIDIFFPWDKNKLRTLYNTRPQQNNIQIYLHWQTVEEDYALF